MRGTLATDFGARRWVALPDVVTLPFLFFGLAWGDLLRMGTDIAMAPIACGVWRAFAGARWR